MRLGTGAPRRALASALVLGVSISVGVGCRTHGTATASFVEGRRIVDLTHALNELGPFWPGTGYFAFRSEVIADFETHGVYSRVYSTPEHLGTHVDAPVHFEKGEMSLDEIPVERLFGPGIVIDISERVRRDADATLSLDDVAAFESAHGRVPAGAIVFLRTGWEERWDDPARYRNADAAGVMHFPGYSASAADFLARQRGVSALGIDTLSVDPGGSREYEAHHAGNRLGLYFIENAARLGELPSRGFDVIVAPIKIEGGSGGQARLFALLPR
jgi:kynurenine formamidase